MGRCGYVFGWEREGVRCGWGERGKTGAIIVAVEHPGSHKREFFGAAFPDLVLPALNLV